MSAVAPAGVVAMDMFSVVPRVTVAHPPNPRQSAAIPKSRMKFPRDPAPSQPQPAVESKGCSAQSPPDGRGKRFNGTRQKPRDTEAKPGTGMSERDLHFNDLRGTAATKFYIARFTMREIAETLAWEEESVKKIIRRYVGRAAAIKARIKKPEAKG